MTKLYDELATWWHLLSPPEDYADEAAFFLSLLADASGSLLELGSGGGNNAYHIKSRFSSVTLVDLSPGMLEVSRQLNPDCEHLIGDMRNVRLNRAFDVVFIHDAIDYMTTLDDLQLALKTAYSHCKSGGTVLIVPDVVKETFEPDTEHGGTDDDRRGIRFLEWSHDPDPDDTTYFTEYVVILRDGDSIISVEHDRHVLGVFPLSSWMTMLEKVGFQARYVVDDYDRHIFIAQK